MKRSFDRPMPVSLHKRLSTKAIKIFKKRCNELEDDLDRSQEDELFFQLSQKDQKALNEEFDYEHEIEEINQYISFLWMTSDAGFDMRDFDVQKEYIEKKSKEYVYPEYTQLIRPIGECKIEDRVFEMGFASNPIYERQAELLLIGVFEWNGLFIARSPPHIGRGWLVCTDPSYIPEDNIGFRTLDDGDRWSRSHGNRMEEVHCSMPFYGISSQWLHDYLIECDIELGYRSPRKKHQAVNFIDGNPYNCLPDNIELVNSRRGRKMMCKICNCETTNVESLVISRQGRKDRVCYECMR